MKKTVCNLYYGIIPLLIIGLSAGYTTFVLAMISLIPLFFVTTRHTIAVFLVMYGGPLCGVIRTMYPSLPLYGLVMEFLGFVLIWDLIKDLLHNNRQAIGAIILTLVFFGLFYIAGPQTEFAATKFWTMCYHGFFMVMGYYAFEKSKKIDAEGLTRLLLLASVCMFTYLIQTIGMHRGAIWDYDWFREQFLYFAKITDWEGTVINYQHVGMLISFATAVFLSQTKLKTPLVLFYIICAIQLVLISGARQGIFGVLIIAVLRFSFFRGDLLHKKNHTTRVLGLFVSLVVALVVVMVFLENIQSNIIANTLQGDTGRETHQLEAIAIFLDNQLCGTGIGGFQYITDHSWPHNLILELLCETGIVGLFVSLTIIISSLVLKKQGLFHVTSSEQFYFLILTAIFVRVMVSSDLRESIELFSAVFAITSAKTALKVKRPRQVVLN